MQRFLCSANQLSASPDRVTAGGSALEGTRHRQRRPTKPSRNLRSRTLHRRGKLHPKIAEYLAQLNDPKAQKILRLSKMPKKRKSLDAVLNEFERMTDSDKALRLIRQLTTEERKEFCVMQEKRWSTRQGDRT